MKYLLLIILAVLAMATPALSMPTQADVDAAKALADSALAKAQQMQDVVNGHEMTIGRLSAQLDSKDENIAELNKKVDDVQKKAAEDVAAANEWSTKLQLFFFNGVGALFTVLALMCFMKSDQGDAMICGFVSGGGFSTAMAIQHYGQQIALVASITYGLLMLAGIAWILWRSHQRRVDGVNQASVIDTAVAAGLPQEWADKLRAWQYKLVGTVGDRMTAEASGKTLKQVQTEGEQAVAKVAA